MRTKHARSLAGAMALLALTAHGAATQGAAAQEAGGVSVGVTAGTTGVGVEADWRLHRNVGLRLGVDWLSLNIDREFEDIAYDGDVTLLSGGPTLDYYPGGGGFRVSGGVRLNGNEVDLTGRPSEPVRIGDRVYQPAEVGTVDGRIGFQDVGYYVGIGYTSRVGKRLNLAFDLGATYQGAPQINLTSNSPVPGLERDLALEEQEIEEEVDRFYVKFYPSLKVKLSYRF
ncbi:MAG TPA: hypothetical protein VEB20_09665 [Azospirillaceae bacterium]|nr:hypothetical protein [Azospirillaceae bacterium]